MKYSYEIPRLLSHDYKVSSFNDTAVVLVLKETLIIIPLNGWFVGSYMMGLWW